MAENIRIDKLETKMDKIEARITKIENNITLIFQEIKRINEKMDAFIESTNNKDAKIDAKRENTDTRIEYNEKQILSHRHDIQSLKAFQRGFLRITTGILIVVSASAIIGLATYFFTR